MIVRALDQNGDWTYGASKDNYLQANAAVAQAIATRLLSFLGDCFFATDAGIDWFTFLGGGKNQLALQLAINAVILNTDNVTGIISSTVAFNEVTRAYSVTYHVTTGFGNVQAVVNQNLGIGPLSPITPLLPQFTQTLLNNVGATPITGALFNHVLFWEVDLAYYIERRTNTQGFIQRGDLRCIYDPYVAQWSVADNVWDGSSGPSTGVTFSIDPSTGQVSYSSDDVTGSNYVGNLIIGSTTSFPAGA